MIPALVLLDADYKTVLLLEYRRCILYVLGLKTSVLPTGTSTFEEEQLKASYSQMCQ
jgi:hypothetical protein